MKYYSRHSTLTRVVQLLVAALSGSIGIVVVGYSMVRFFYALSYINNDAAPVSGLLTENLESTLPFLCAVGLIIIVPVVSSFFICAVSLTMFPSISIRENGFRVHSAIGKSEWLGWDAIKKARKVELPRPVWMIGIEGLGWLYWPMGFFFWLWMPGIHLTQSIDGYHELLGVLKEKRPDLFVPYR